MELTFPFDPIKRSEEIESIVMRDFKRLYYRFRSSGHYGGVVTADASGCNIMCAYCWNYNKNTNPVYGEFYSPADVVLKLKKEAAKTRIHTFRISGAEPILGENSVRHLADVLSSFPGRFVVETNGIMLGFNPSLLDNLLPHHPYFRLTFKGDSSMRFQEITGADGVAFDFQKRALRELQNRGGTYRIAAMAGAVGSIALQSLFPEEEIEWEEFRNFGNAERNLASRNITLDKR